jgi:hypothetical protein
MRTYMPFLLLLHLSQQVLKTHIEQYEDTYIAVYEDTYRAV